MRSIMTALLKSIIACSLAILFCLWMTLSWATDSTGATPPIVSANQPFLLDTGYADVNLPATPYGTWPSGPTTPGQYWDTGWFQSATSGAPEAIRLTVLTNQHQCP